MLTAASLQAQLGPDPAPGRAAPGSREPSAPHLSPTFLLALNGLLFAGFHLSRRVSITGGGSPPSWMRLEEAAGVRPSSLHQLHLI